MCRGDHWSNVKNLRGLQKDKKHGKMLPLEVVTLKPETKFLRIVKKTIEEEKFQKQYTIDNERNFIRDRKLSFSDTILYTIGNTRGSSCLEAYKFCEAINCDSISDVAIRKARAKIAPEAFYELFLRTAEAVPQNKKYHGYQLIAVDGMKGELPKTPEFTEKYCHHDDNIPLFHTVAAYDVLNEVFLDALFCFGGISEFEYGVSLVDQMAPRNKDCPRIWVFDRGFPSLRLLQHLHQHNEKYVLRVSTSFLKEVNEFTNSKAVDKEVQISFDKRRMATNRVVSDGITEFSIRCVRVKLKENTEEILVTNLNREEFPKRYIKEIYGLRWGIETSYNYLKHAVFIEEFTSRKENGIRQDFYSTLLMNNFITCVCGSVWADIPLKKNEN